jgi:hypothetical protein
MPQLDSYLVTLGMKGQNVVLATMDKIHKKGKDLTKKQTIPLTTKTGTAKESKATKTKPEKTPLKEKTKPEKTPLKEKTRSKKTPPETPPDEKASGKFSKAVDRFGNTTTNFAHTMSRFDPAHAISTGLSALAKIAIAGVPFAIAEAGLNMATNMISMAKENAATQHGLVQRNATAEYYGEKINRISRISNEEQAMLRMTIGASMGKIQQPLADAINKLLTGKESLNTAALARVASGNWASTGTDKGWMLQQLSDSFQGLPPSIAQKFQASLLKNYGAEEIQKTNERMGESEAQQMNADWQKRGEAQTADIHDAMKANTRDLFELNDKLKKLQVDMVSAGGAVATALNFVAHQIQAMGTKIQVSK